MVLTDAYPVQWAGRRAVVALPERLAGLRKDGSTFPVRVRRVLMPASVGQFTLTVIRDMTGIRPGDPAELACPMLELLDSVVTTLFHAGLSLHLAMDLSRDEAAPRIDQVIQSLDDVISEIRDTAFTIPRQRAPT